MASGLLTREEVLGGLPARRASALLFLIESRTAQLVERARHTMAPFRTEGVDRERELAFVEAFALGREPPLRPTIQDLERHAPQWTNLVPENPRLRAALAHQLGQKYRFGASDVPAMRSALGLDDPGVRSEHQRLFGKPLDTIYVQHRSPMARLRWTGAALVGWVESLPPFWTAFALTLTETVGAGILALPIALAGVGPLAGVVLLVVFGLVNVLTIAWMAEAAARTASMRYGGAYFGRFVTEYLGSAGSALLTLALLVIAVAGMLAYAIGVVTTLASATGIAATIWVVLLFSVVGYMVSRDSLSSTVASALGFGVLNLVLIGVLAILGFAHLSSSNLSRVELPGLGGNPFDLSIVGLIFGVVLISYFGHTSVGNCAALVLRRDPSARSLIWGAVAAQIVAIIVYSTWVLAINGSIAPDALEGHAGTALDPLADIAGQGVYAVGSVFVVLAMGMGSIHMALGLVNIVRERLPKQSQPVVLLPRRSGQLVFTPRRNADDQGPRLVLTYLGLANGQPRFRLRAQVAGHTQNVTRAGAEPWTAREVLDHLPEARPDEIDMRVETIDADEQQARLRVTSGMSMKYEGRWTTAGVDLAGLLDTDGTASRPDADEALLRWMLRRGEVSLGEAAAWAGQDARQTRDRLRALVERGDVREVRHGRATGYRAVVARRRARSVPDGMAGATAATPPPSRRIVAGEAVRTRINRAADGLLSERGRLILEYSPLVVIFLVTEWLLISERASFTLLLSFAGVVAVPIFAGIFPCMLLQSSRRKGDLVPGTVSRFLGRPWLTIGVYALFLIGILLHGFLIWQQTGERAAAIAASVIMLLVTFVAIHRGALNSRTVVILRDDQRPGGTTGFEIVSSGCRTPVEARVRLGERVEEVHAATIDMPNLASLREITAQLPADRAVDLKVWANRITPEGETVSLPAHARLNCDREEREVDLGLAGGQAILPRSGGACGLVIALDQPPSPQKTSTQPAAAGRPRVDLESLLSTESDTDSVPAKGD